MDEMVKHAIERNIMVTVGDYGFLCRWLDGSIGAGICFFMWVDWR